MSPSIFVGIPMEINSVSRAFAFSSPEPFSLGHLLKIRLWVRQKKGEI
jgi:hypothetical protein